MPYDPIRAEASKIVFSLSRSDARNLLSRLETKFDGEGGFIEDYIIPELRHALKTEPPGD